MTIIEFLDARISEDEARATAATPGPWAWGEETDEWGDCGPSLETVERGEVYSDGSQGAKETIIGSWGHDANGITVEDADAAHIAAHDPSRALAECAAKRKMLANVPKQSDIFNPLGGTSAYVLLCLAAVYAEHPDYLEEWKL